YSYLPQELENQFKGKLAVFLFTGKTRKAEQREIRRILIYRRSLKISSKGN
ncbi:hypothetical protein J2S19_002046, partial [Metabacillus malikii]|nr:hypothetical protein [Metabacillus malikii]